MHGVCVCMSVSMHAWCVCVYECEYACVVCVCVYECEYACVVCVCVHDECARSEGYGHGCAQYLISSV